MICAPDVAEAIGFYFGRYPPYNTAWLPVRAHSMTDHPSNPVQAQDRTANSEAASSAGGGTGGPGDETLLERVRTGDQTAMTDLFDRYAGLVYSVALRVLHDTGQAEDLMQDVFFQMWKNPGSYVQGRGSLGAWLAVVARNRAIDVLRRRKPCHPVEEVVLAANTNLASDIERNRIMEKVREILKALPAEQQKSVELAFFEGLTHAEIAAKTGDPLGTVKTRIRTALISLRKAVQA